MKTISRKIVLMLAGFILVPSLYAQIPNLRKATQAVKETVQPVQQSRQSSAEVLQEKAADVTENSGNVSSVLVTGKESNVIVFSKSAINPANPNGLTNEFIAGDFIYGLASFPKSVMDMIDMEEARKLEVMITYDLNGERINTTTGTLSREAVQKNYIIFEFVANPDNLESYHNQDFIFKKYPNPPASDGPIRVADDMRKWPSGNHKVLITLNLNYQPVISGEFAISGEDFGVYRNIRDKIVAAADRGAAASATMPAAKMSNKDIENQMLAAFKNSNDWKTGRLKAKETSKIAIVDPDWTIRRHELTGAILHRYIRAAIAVKTPDGSCGIYKLVTFQQDYVGGQYQPLKYDGAGDLSVIECANIN